MAPDGPVESGPRALLGFHPWHETQNYGGGLHPESSRGTITVEYFQVIQSDLCSALAAPLQRPTFTPLLGIGWSGRLKNPSSSIAAEVVAITEAVRVLATLPPHRFGKRYSTRRHAAHY